jgi:hypothetical protein
MSDHEALEKAYEAAFAGCLNNTERDLVRRGISAFLAALDDDEKLVERLRYKRFGYVSGQDCHEAADRLQSLSAEVAGYRQSLNRLGDAYDALDAENAMLREALTPFEAIAAEYEDRFLSEKLFDPEAVPYDDDHMVYVELKYCRDARAALSPSASEKK